MTETLRSVSGFMGRGSHPPLGFDDTLLFLTDEMEMFGPDDLVGDVLISDAELAAFSYDPLGSVVDVTDSGGAAQWAFSYEPFGAARTATTCRAVDPLRFIGEYKDVTTSLYDLRAHQYDGLRGWRIDYDPSNGFHVNWWDKTSGPKRASGWRYGSNIMQGGTYDNFLSVLSHFPSH